MAWAFPQVWGSMRLAGNVIWARPLIEKRRRQSSWQRRTQGRRRQRLLARAREEFLAAHAHYGASEHEDAIFDANAPQEQLSARLPNLASAGPLALSDGLALSVAVLRRVLTFPSTRFPVPASTRMAVLLHLLKWRDLLHGVV
jgi:hypothetical protein